MLPSEEGGYDLGEYPATQKGEVKVAHRNLKRKSSSRGSSPQERPNSHTCFEIAKDSGEGSGSHLLREKLNAEHLEGNLGGKCLPVVLLRCGLSE